MRIYTGGEELRRAAAALSGISLAPRPSVNLPTQQAIALFTRLASVWQY